MALSRQQQSQLHLVGTAIVGIFLIGLLVKQRATVSAAFTQVLAADPLWFSIGVGVIGLSLLATARVYMSLSTRPLPFGRTVLVQTAGFCVNKLLPSGSGAAGVSFLYLRANKLPGVQAAAVVACNNVLGFIGHGLLLAGLLMLQPQVLQRVHAVAIPSGTTLGLLGLCVAGAAIAIGIVARTRLQRIGHALRVQLRPVLRNRVGVARALGYSMLLTLCYVIALWASTRAIGVQISLAAAIIALSSSVLATSAVPSPGGIGAAELGAYGGLVAVGVDPQAALAAALVYRVCSFWLPLIIGVGALIAVQRRGYLRRPVKATSKATS